MREILENQPGARRRDDFLNLNDVNNAPAAPGIEP
jgi:hypothetical protein